MRAVRSIPLILAALLLLLLPPPGGAQEVADTVIGDIYGPPATLNRVCDPALPTPRDTQEGPRYGIPQGFTTTCVLSATDSIGQSIPGEYAVGATPEGAISWVQVNDSTFQITFDQPTQGFRLVFAVRPAQIALLFGSYTNPRDPLTSARFAWGRMAGAPPVLVEPGEEARICGYGAIGGDPYRLVFKSHSGCPEPAYWTEDLPVEPLVWEMDPNPAFVWLDDAGLLRALAEGEQPPYLQVLMQPHLEYRAPSRVERYNELRLERSLARLMAGDITN